jgi:hypothetical protein
MTAANEIVIPISAAVPLLIAILCREMLLGNYLY